MFDSIKIHPIILFILAVIFNSTSAHAGSGEIVRAADYVAGSVTGGIQEAINASCEDLTDGKRCGIVMLPKGRIEILETITIQSSHGLKLIGHGSGSAEGTANQLAGTSLVWNGSGDLTGGVISIQGGSNNVFSDFLVLARENRSSSSSINEHCIVFSGANWITIERAACSSASVSGIEIVASGNSRGIQLSDFRVENSSICIDIADANIKALEIADLNCENWSSYGIYRRSGVVSLRNSQFRNTTANNSSAIYIDQNEDQQIHVDSVSIEIQNGDFIHAAGSTPISASFENMNLSGSASSDNQRCIFWERPGSLIYSNNQCFSKSSGTVSVEINPSSKLEFSFLGNTGNYNESIATSQVFQSLVVPIIFDKGLARNIGPYPGQDKPEDCLFSDALDGEWFIDKNCDGSKGIGEPYLSQKTKSNTHGMMMWVSNGTGDAACQSQGLICHHVINVANCSTDVNGQDRQALCK